MSKQRSKICVTNLMDLLYDKKIWKHFIDAKNAAMNKAVICYEEFLIRKQWTHLMYHLF